MLYNAPLDWKDLQEKVCLILNQIGFEASIGKLLTTGRGEVEVDVYAVDPFSIDRIDYIIECKNWDAKIPQTVVHAFTTVMTETGSNVGYIISKAGFQKGAYDYIKNTSIKNFTFDEFQKRYEKRWIMEYFNPKVYDASDALIQYTELINSRRERYLSTLNSAELDWFRTLQKKYTSFANLLLSYSQYHLKNNYQVNIVLGELPQLDFVKFKDILSQYSGTQLQSACYADLLDELLAEIAHVTGEFHALFGKDIFQD